MISPTFKRSLPQKPVNSSPQKVLAVPSWGHKVPTFYDIAYLVWVNTLRTYAISKNVSTHRRTGDKFLPQNSQMGLYSAV
jgi:hypothetical protein